MTKLAPTHNVQVLPVAPQRQQAQASTTISDQTGIQRHSVTSTRTTAGDQPGIRRRSATNTLQTGAPIHQLGPASGQRSVSDQSATCIPRGHCSAQDPPGTANKGPRISMAQDRLAQSCAKNHRRALNVAARAARLAVDAATTTVGKALLALAAAEIALSAAAPAAAGAAAIAAAAAATSSAAARPVRVAARAEQAAASAATAAAFSTGKCARAAARAKWAMAKAADWGMRVDDRATTIWKAATDAAVTAAATASATAAATAAAATDTAALWVARVDRARAAAATDTLKKDAPGGFTRAGPGTGGCRCGTHSEGRPRGGGGASTNVHHRQEQAAAPVMTGTSRASKAFCQACDRTAPGWKGCNACPSGEHHSTPCRGGGASSTGPSRRDEQEGRAKQEAVPVRSALTGASAFTRRAHVAGGRVHPVPCEKHRRAQFRDFPEGRAEHARDIQGTCGGHEGDMPGTCKGHAGHMRESCEGPAGDMQGTSGEHPGGMLVTFRGPGDMPGTCRGGAATTARPSRRDDQVERAGEASSAGLNVRDTPGPCKPRKLILTTSPASEAHQYWAQRVPFWRVRFSLRPGPIPGRSTCLFDCSGGQHGQHCKRRRTQLWDEQQGRRSPERVWGENSREELP